MPATGQSQPGQREAIGRGMPCRCTTRRARKPAQQAGSGPGDGRGARNAGQMPGRRGARGPGAIDRCGPRRQWPGMKPGHYGRPGMKPGRPEGVFMVAPHHHGVFIEVCPPLLIFPPIVAAAGTGAPGGTPRSQGSRPCAVGRPRVAVPVLGLAPLHLRLLGPHPPVLGTAPTGIRALPPRPRRRRPEGRPRSVGIEPTAGELHGLRGPSRSRGASLGRLPAGHRALHPRGPRPRQ